ncbi:MAG: hypothetical protein QOE58_1096, partial [Actinomycetota bacterium]|nr:hypothetical protein [Actinomycetota bacterium]
YHYPSSATLADLALVDTMTDQAGATTTYKYDGLNRLNKATTSTGIISDWTYDNDGNRTIAAKSGTATTYSAFNGADQLCWTSTTSATGCASPPTGATTYTYDTTGNQTSDKVGTPTLANTFNVFNQLTDTLIGGTTTQTSTYADTTNTERLTAGATSFLNGTLGITSQTTRGHDQLHPRPLRQPDRHAHRGPVLLLHTRRPKLRHRPDQQHASPGRGLQLRPVGQHHRFRKPRRHTTVATAQLAAPSAKSMSPPARS